jgi:lysophospholipase L1-like esterase
LANSWATGTNPKVRSIYFRLRQRNGAKERAFNAAEPGSTMALLSFQAGRIPKGVDLVTVEMGTNDACDATSAADFRSGLADGLRAIAARAPAARIVVLSIFDHLAVWDAVKMVPGARLRRGFCSAATTPSDRPALRKAIRILNHELATVCGRHPQCRFDGGAAFRIRWTRADVSTVDYFHPSLAGQRKIADAVWASGAVTRN